jgi:hypothetical protein
MRKIFEHPAYHEVGLYESVLNSHGIETTIKNQNVSSLAGEVPFTAAYPELWILDDERYDEAISLIKEFRKRSLQDAPSADWVCPKCGESVPGNFSSCWNCDAPRP